VHTLTWIPLPDAAVALKQRSQSVHSLVQLGQLRSERRGSRWFVAKEDVDRVLREAARAAADQPAGAA
jgi:hypothetical protein